MLRSKLTGMERVDGDTWDLATTVGATATMVAAGRARASKAAHPLIEDRFAEPLVRAVGVDFFTRWATGELDAADTDIPDWPWGMQRMTDMMAVRTRHIDAFFADAVAAGIRQVVILASGLDARGYRLPWPAGTTVFEIDQLQVLEFKAATIAAVGAEPTAEIRAVPVDLRDDWLSALRQAGLDSGLPTAWAAEGLLYFLPPDAQDLLLDNITALSAEGSRLLTETFLEDPEAEKAVQIAVQKWRECGLDISLDNLGYSGKRNDVTTYLQARDWSTAGTRMGQLLADNGLALPLAPAGQSALLDNYYCTAVRQKTGAS